MLHCYTDFHSVHPDLMLEILLRWELPDFSDKLTEEQSQQFMRAIADDECSFDYLNIWRSANTLKISPEVFGIAVSSINDMLLDTDITQEHIGALLKQIVEKERPIGKLELRNLSYIIFENFEPALVGKALNKLEKVILDKTWLSVEQIQDTLERFVVGEGSKLDELLLGDVAPHEIEDTDPALGKQVERKIGPFYELEVISSDEM